MVYKWIGKAVVVYGFAYVRRRYARQIRIGAGAGLLAIAAAAALGIYLAGRDLPEG